LWAIGVEIAFGDGSFGWRATGTISIGASIPSEIILNPAVTSNNGSLISYGGWWTIESGAKIGIPSGWWGNATMSNYGFVQLKVTDGIAFNSSRIQQRTNAPYDVWVRYTKS
jgi:hypothetical protein